MTATVADATTMTRTGRPTLAVAGIEIRRYLRHPVTIVSWLLFGWLLLDVTVLDPATTVTVVSEQWSLQVGFYLGVSGFVVANRLTRSTDRCNAIVEASPMDEPRRTLALASTGLLPLAAAIVSGLVALVVWGADSGGHPSGKYAAFDSGELAAFHGTVVLAALGGPLVGLAVARWWRWTMAATLSCVFLVLWCVASGAWTENAWLVLNHMAAPFSVLVTGQDSGTRFRQGGALEWHLVYVAGLCALALLAALVRGADGRRRRTILAGLATTFAVTVLALVLSVLTGPGGSTV